MDTPAGLEAVVVAWLERDIHAMEWTPAVVRVEDAGPEWRVFYSSQEYIETGSILWALGGNLPLLVDKSSLAVRIDEAWLATADVSGEPQGN